MKHISNCIRIFMSSVIVLSITDNCFAMASPPGHGASQGSGSIIASFLPAIIIFIIVFLIPLVKAFDASKKADKFKSLVFVITFYEWLGWIICITIIGIPVGLSLVLAAQSIRVLIEIEKNTSETRNLLKKG